MRVNNEFDHSEDLSTQVEGVSESTFLALFCSQSFDGLQIEVVVEMEEVEILSVNQKIEHVVALATDLETSFNPVQFCQLEELCLLESFEKLSLILCFWSFVME